MSLVQLCERGTMRSDHIMGEFADNVFVRVMHRRMSGYEFRMLIVVGHRFGLQLARRETKVWMEDECIISRMDSNLGSPSSGGKIGGGRVINDCTPVPIVGKFEIGKGISTVECSMPHHVFRLSRSTRRWHSIVNSAEIDPLEINLIRAS